MPFSNPIVGGTALVRPAINSPNFVTGVSGWSINRDGTAEFAAAVLRGELDLGGNVPHTPRIVFTGTMPAPLDTYDFKNVIGFTGNPVNAVVGLIEYIGTAGDSYQFMVLCRDNPTTVAGVFMGSVNVGAMLEASAGFPKGVAYRFGLGMFSYGTTEINAISQYAGFSTMINGILEIGADTRFQDTIVKINAFNNPIVHAGSNDFLIDNTSQGRGLIDEVHATTSSAVIGTTEAVILTGNTTGYKDGRAFEIRIGGFYQSSVAAGTGILRVRRNSLTGTILSQINVSSVNSAQIDYRTFTDLLFENTSGAVIADNVVLTLQSVGAGTTMQQLANAAGQRYLRIYDIGTATDYSAPAM